MSYFVHNYPFWIFPICFEVLKFFLSIFPKYLKTMCSALEIIVLNILIHHRTPISLLALLGKYNVMAYEPNWLNCLPNMKYDVGYTGDYFIRVCPRDCLQCQFCQSTGRYPDTPDMSACTSLRFCATGCTPWVCHIGVVGPENRIVVCLPMNNFNTL